MNLSNSLSLTPYPSLHLFHPVVSLWACVCMRVCILCVIRHRLWIETVAPGQLYATRLENKTKKHVKCNITNIIELKHSTVKKNELPLTHNTHHHWA